MIRTIFTALILTVIFEPVFANDYDPLPVWPLCGRITENPPPGWQPSDGCPEDRFGHTGFSDAPFSSTFGPRPLASEGNRYDFHRGMDIATPLNTPIFAIADGIVQSAGPHPSYSDPMIRLRHFRPGETGCSGPGCYNSLYLHVNGWVVGEDEAVQKGQLIGYTGASGASGFQHLHFEIRDAPGFDPFSSWSRDAVHPLGVLPYDVPNNTSISFGTVDNSNPNAVTAEVTVTSNRYDLVRVEMTVFDQNLQVVEQPGNTPNILGYDVLPPFFDMEAANFQYSHKNSSSFPWASFSAGGVNECPYHQDHGPSYNANVHLDAQHPLDFHQGLFNGVHITTTKYWPNSDYWVKLDFLQLQGPAQCIEATATFASGDTTVSQWGQCDGSEEVPPQAPSNLTAEVTTTGKGKNRQKTAVLAWMDNAVNETAYRVERCLETGKGKNKQCDFSQVGSDLPPDTTSYVDTPGSGTFKYRVKAVNEVGEGVSNVVKI